jgi:hypothetical protein
MSSEGVVQSFSKFKDKVTVVSLEKKKHPLGNWGGKVGELVSRFMLRYSKKDFCQITFCN